MNWCSIRIYCLNSNIYTRAPWKRVRCRPELTNGNWAWSRQDDVFSRPITICHFLWAHHSIWLKDFNNISSNYSAHIIWCYPINQNIISLNSCHWSTGLVWFLSRKNLQCVCIIRVTKITPWLYIEKVCSSLCHLSKSISSIYYVLFNQMNWPVT